jgi:hypothetical protein
MRIGDNDDSQSTKTPTKRKHGSKDTYPLISNTERISPDLKKNPLSIIWIATTLDFHHQKRLTKLERLLANLLHIKR